MEWERPGTVLYKKVVEHKNDKQKGRSEHKRERARRTRPRDITHLNRMVELRRIADKFARSDSSAAAEANSDTMSKIV